MLRRLARLAGDYYKWFAVSAACVTAVLWAWQASFDPEVAVARLYGWVCDRAPDVERFTGKACPASFATRPRVAEYQQRLSDFRAAIISGDEGFLQKLARTGFAVQSDDVCEVATWLGERTGPQVLSEAGTEVFLRSIPENHQCDTGSWMLRRKSVSIPVVLLDRSLYPHAISENGEGDRTACGVDLAGKYWPRQTELIHRVVQKTGMHADFSQAAAGYRALFEKLKAMPSQAYESACRQALLTEQPSPEFIFSSASCRGMERLQTRWRLEQAMGASAEDAATRVCKGAGPLDLAVFEKSLTRWTPSVRAEGR